MIALVTGAGGFIGGNLVRQLLEAGYTVRAFIRNTERAVEGLNVDVFRGDILEPETLGPAMDGVDVVFHVAGLIELKRSAAENMQRVNVDGVENIISACRSAGVKKLIHFSSIHALRARPFDAPFSEKNKLAGSDSHPYDHTKAQGEQKVMAAAAAGMDAVIVNPTGVIGPIDFEPSRMGEAILMLAQGKMPALINTGFNWVDVRDVCSSAIAAVEKGISGERYLLYGHWASFGELAKNTHAAGGRRPPMMTVPMWLAQIGAPFAEFWAWITGSEPLFSRDSLHMLIEQNPDLDGEKSASVLGHSPRSLEETISDSLEWFAEAGMWTRR